MDSRLLNNFYVGDFSDLVVVVFQSQIFMSQCSATNTGAEQLTWKSFLLLVVFLLMLIPVAHPFRVKVPHWMPWSKYCRQLTINFMSSSLLATLFLVLLTVIDAVDIRAGIVGNDSIQPYSILILFMSLTYICVSVDCTGVLEYIAIQIAIKSSESYLKLFLGFYVFNSLLTLVLSNDVLILTMTPLIVYVCKTTNLDPRPLLIAEFMTANTWSIGLMIGNPTNLIVAIAYKMEFLAYSKWMFLPAAVAALITIGIVYWMYCTEMPRAIERDDYAMNTMLKNVQLDARWSIGISAAVLVGCLILLAASNFLNVPVWVITLAFCAVSLAKDAFIFSRQHRMGESNTPSVQDLEMEMKSVQQTGSLDRLPTNSEDNVQNNIDPITSEPTPIMENRALSILKKRVPWNIAPFVICMFILVEALDSKGWLSRLAVAFHSVAALPIYASAISMALISAFLCIILNNQPMTIMLTKILLLDQFRCGLTAGQEFIAAFAVIIGSNLGGNLALNGALAGLMWNSILEVKGVKGVTYFSFMRDGMTSTVPALVLSGITLAGLVSTSGMY